MAVEYDARRPRLPRELAATIDRLRGQMPFNAFVVWALEQALEKALASRSSDSGESSVVAAPASSRASEPAPSEPPVPKKDPLANVPGLKRGSEVPYRKPFVPRPKSS